MLNLRLRTSNMALVFNSVVGILGIHAAWRPALDSVVWPPTDFGIEKVTTRMDSPLEEK